MYQENLFYLNIIYFTSKITLQRIYFIWNKFIYGIMKIQQWQIHPLIMRGGGRFGDSEILVKDTNGYNGYKFSWRGNRSICFPFRGIRWFRLVYQLMREREGIVGGVSCFVGVGVAERSLTCSSDKERSRSRMIQRCNYCNKSLCFNSLSKANYNSNSMTASSI